MMYKLLIMIFSLTIFLSKNAISQESLLPTTNSFFDIVDSIEYLLTDTSSIPITEDESSIIKENVFDRWVWFWSSRIDNNGGFKEYGKQLREIGRTLSGHSTKKSMSLASWTALGPTSAPTASCLGVDRSTGLTQVLSIWANSTDLYVGLNGGGLWKRNDTVWDNLTDNVIALSVSDIEIDNSGKIYLATGWDGQNGTAKGADIYSMGIIYSTNDGSSWVTDRMTSVPDEDLFMEKILIHPTSQSTIYALSRRTVYKSTNGGYTWTDTQAPALSNNDWYVNMVFKESDPNTIFICSRGQNSLLGEQIKGSVFKTTNGGTTWSNTNLVDNLTYGTQKPHWIDLATSADDPNAVYIVYRDIVSNLSTLEKSTDGGSNWTTLVNQDFIYTKSYMMHNMTISSEDADKIYVGGISQYKYDAINNEFDRIGSSLHDDLRDFYIVSSGGTETIYQGNDAGIYYSTDDGNNWTNISNGIQGSLFYMIAISDENPDIYLGGVGDCGTHFYNGTSWSNMCLGGDGGTCLINEHNTSNMFAMVNKKFYYTKNGGSNWSNTGERTVGYNKPIALHPSSSKIYLSTANDGWWHRVRVSTNYGDSWSDYSPSYANDIIWAMAISDSDPDYFYLGKTKRELEPTGWTYITSIVRTTNDGTNWSDRTSNLGSITSEAIMTDIEIHPEDPDKVWVCFGGLSDGKKIYYTSNGGSSWTNISYNLPNLPLMKIEYDIGNHLIYIANDIGVYFLEDGETDWTRMGDFPYAITTGLELNHQSGKLIAATWGRGLWETNIEGHCYDGTNQTITSATTWTTDRELCQNLVVQSGNLTIQCNAIMPFEATITVKNGATLTIDGGTIANANIIVESGGLLEVENDGLIELNNNDELEILTGALFDLDFGEIISIAMD